MKIFIIFNNDKINFSSLLILKNNNGRKIINKEIKKIQFCFELNNFFLYSSKKILIIKIKNLQYYKF